MQAWGIVLNKLSDYYEYYDHTEFPDVSDDPVLEQCLHDIGGWKYLRNSDNPVADRARFLADYEERRRRAREDARLLPQVRALRDQLAERQRALPERSEATEHPAPVLSLIGKLAGSMRA